MGPMELNIANQFFEPWTIIFFQPPELFPLISQLL